MLVRRYVGSRCGVSSRLTSDCSRSASPMITCVYSISCGAVELALEQLRRAADAAERILDLVREAADQLAVRLLLLEQALLARDLQLLVDVAELEQQRGIGPVDRRHGAGQVQLALAADAELELLLGVRRAASATALSIARRERRARRRRARAACGPRTSAATARTGFPRPDSRRSTRPSERSISTAVGEQLQARIRRRRRAAIADDGKKRSFTATPHPRARHIAREDIAAIA